MARSTKKRLRLKKLAKEKKKITPINNRDGGIFAGKVVTIRNKGNG